MVKVRKRFPSPAGRGRSQRVVAPLLAKTTDVGPVLSDVGPDLYPSILFVVGLLIFFVSIFICVAIGGFSTRCCFIRGSRSTRGSRGTRSTRVVKKERLYKAPLLPLEEVHLMSGEEEENDGEYFTKVELHGEGAHMMSRPARGSTGVENGGNTGGRRSRTSTNANPSPAVGPVRAPSSSSRKKKASRQQLDVELPEPPPSRAKKHNNNLHNNQLEHLEQLKHQHHHNNEVNQPESRTEKSKKRDKKREKPREKTREKKKDETMDNFLDNKMADSSGCGSCLGLCGFGTEEKPKGEKPKKKQKTERRLEEKGSIRSGSATTTTKTYKASSSIRSPLKKVSSSSPLKKASSKRAIKKEQVSVDVEGEHTRAFNDNDYNDNDNNDDGEEEEEGTLETIKSIFLDIWIFLGCNLRKIKKEKKFIKNKHKKIRYNDTNV